ncbi:hypothetical protein [Lysinibacillus parviboronicapiens]|uniref:hypothetical protein n=1 Tax=Lysinibacillus parviboronicapiens TaxID=436516 RepID=UPI00128FFF9F|nr:hypothetical protein [Lysinibacillus parviboronicapiens]
MSFLILFLLIFITVVLIKNNASPSEQSLHNDIRDNYAEEIGEKLQSSSFTKEVLQALRADGYFPDSTVGYLVDSPDKQFISIYLHNSDKLDKASKEEIQKIINRVAKNNNLNSFIVDIKETN